MQEASVEIRCVLSVLTRDISGILGGEQKERTTAMLARKVAKLSTSSTAATAATSYSKPSGRACMRESCFKISTAKTSSRSEECEDWDEL